MASISRNYNPTTEELTASIEEILVANPDLVSSGKPSSNAKQVHAKLLEKHPAWKVPERRVAKFTKRAAGGTSPAAGNSDEERSVSTRGSLRKFLSGRASKRSNNNNNTSTNAESDDDASVSTRGSIRSFLSKRRNKSKQDAAATAGDDNASTSSSPTRRSGRGGFLRRGKSKQAAPSNVQTNDLPVTDDLPTPDSGVPSPMLNNGDDDEEEPKLLASPVNTLDDDEGDMKKEEKEDAQKVNHISEEAEEEGKKNVGDDEKEKNSEEDKVDSNQTRDEEDAIAAVAPAAAEANEKDALGNNVEKDIVTEEKKEATPSKEPVRQDTTASATATEPASNAMLPKDGTETSQRDNSDDTDKEAVAPQIPASVSAEEEKETAVQEEKDAKPASAASEDGLPVVETVITAEEEEQTTPTVSVDPATPVSDPFPPAAFFKSDGTSDPDPPLSTFSNHNEEDRQSPEKLEQALSSLPIDLATDAAAIQTEQDSVPQEQQQVDAVVTATEHDTDPPMDLFDVETFVTSPSASLPESPLASNVGAQADEKNPQKTPFDDVEPAKDDVQPETAESLALGDVVAETTPSSPSDMATEHEEQAEEAPSPKAGSPFVVETATTSATPLDNTEQTTEDVASEETPTTPTPASSMEPLATKEEEQLLEETAPIDATTATFTEVASPTAAADLPTEEEERPEVESSASESVRVVGAKDATAPPDAVPPAEPEPVTQEKKLEEVVSVSDSTQNMAAVVVGGATVGAAAVAVVSSPNMSDEHENGDKLESGNDMVSPSVTEPAVATAKAEGEDDGFVLVNMEDVPRAVEIAANTTQASPSAYSKSASVGEKLPEPAAQTTVPAAAMMEKDRDPSGHDNEQLHSGMDLFDNFQDTTKDSAAPPQDYDEDEEFVQKREETAVAAVAAPTEEAPGTNEQHSALPKGEIPQDIADMITRETPRSLSNFVVVLPEDLLEDKKEAEDATHNPAVSEERLDAGLKLFEGFSNNEAATGMFDESSKEFTSIDAISLPPNKSATRGLGNIYEDDNDGKKKSSCQECQGSCVIL